MRNRRWIFIGMVLAMGFLLLVSTGGTQGASTISNGTARIDSLASAMPQDLPLSPSTQNVPAVNNSHFVIPGTAWVAERRGQLKFTYVGWGTVFGKKKAPGAEWVHIPIPMPTYIKGITQKISTVEFCARTATTTTRPVQLDLWDVDSRFYTGAITAWPINVVHCHSVGFNPPIWKSALSMSVKLQFADLTNTITMEKAWVNLTE
jgi:hypothetical protein